MNASMDLENGGEEIVEVMEEIKEKLESKQVAWAREFSAAHFRSIVLRPGERELPIGQQMEEIAADLIRRMEPRDPVEEMLVAQMVWMHGRVVQLTRIASAQKNLEWSALMNEQADRAANLFRRQMLALAEYRRPRKRSFTAIKQANIAGQQVVTS